MKSLSNMNKLFSYLAIILFSSIPVIGQEIQIFSPEPNSTLAKEDVLIAASFFGIEGVDPTNVRITINGENVSKEADIDEDMLSFSPVDLSPGPQNVQILINRAGYEPVIKNFSFTVLGEGDKRAAIDYKIGGRATSGFRYEQIGKEELNIANIGGSINGSAFNWLKFKANMKLTTEEDPLLQPRNRFGFNLTLGKYADINLGDFNPRVTRLTVDGKRIRGFRLKTQLSYFHFSGIFGELARNVQGNEEVDQSYSVRSFSIEGDDQILQLTRKGYTFRQNILSVRTGFGKGEIGQWGIGFVKVKDDIGSVSSNLNNALIRIDSSFTDQALSPGEYTYSDLMKNSNISLNLEERNNWAGKTPNDNLVISTDLGFFFDRKRIVLEGELAFSLLNRNIWDGAVTKAQLDTLMDEDPDGKLFGETDLDIIPIDPADIEDYFVINQNMSPLIPVNPGMFGDSATVSTMEGLLSMPSLAYRTKARLSYFGHYFTVEYSQVGPEFYNLANPYLLNNNRQFTVSDRIQLMDGRMLLSLMYRHQDNDILIDQPVVKSQNTISANLTYLPGPTLPSINLMFRTSSRDNGVSAIDTLSNTIDGELFYSYKDNRENTRTDNISATISHNLSFAGFKHDLSFTVMNYVREDLISAGRDLDTNFINPAMTSQVINLVATTKFNIPLKTTFSMTMNGAEFNTGPSVVANQDLLSMKFEGEYKLFSERLSVLAGVNYLNGEGLSEISRMGLLAGARYRIMDDLFAQIRSELRQNLAAETDKNNVIAIASLNYSF